MITCICSFSRLEYLKFTTLYIFFSDGTCFDDRTSDSTQGIKIETSVVPSDVKVVSISGAECTQICKHKVSDVKGMFIKKT